MEPVETPDQTPVEYVPVYGQQNNVLVVLGLVAIFGLALVGIIAILNKKC